MGWVIGVCVGFVLGYLLGVIAVVELMTDRGKNNTLFTLNNVYYRMHPCDSKGRYLSKQGGHTTKDNVVLVKAGNSR